MKFRDDKFNGRGAESWSHVPDSKAALITVRCITVRVEVKDSTLT